MRNQWRGFAAAAALIGLVVAASLAAESESFKVYKENWEKAEAAFAKKDFALAAAHYEKVGAVFPYEPSCRFQLGCCYAQLQDAERAFRHLNEAVQYGWHQVDRFESEESLASLRQRAEFREIVRQAAACSNETFVIHVGKNVDVQKPAPAVVFLHGLGIGPRSEVPYWKSAADKLGVVLIAPRGVTAIGPTMFGWQRNGAKDSKSPDYFDLPAARARIEQALAAAKKSARIADDRIAIAGFSQGGGVALQLVKDAPDYIGAVAVSSLCQSSGTDAWATALRSRKPRIALLAGAFDPLTPRSRSLAQDLRAASVEFQFDECKDVGHEYPPDFTDRLERTLRFVLRLKDARPE